MGGVVVDSALLNDDELEVDNDDIRMTDDDCCCARGTAATRITCSLLQSELRDAEANLHASSAKLAELHAGRGKIHELHASYIESGLTPYVAEGLQGADVEELLEADVTGILQSQLFDKRATWQGAAATWESARSSERYSSWEAKPDGSFARAGAEGATNHDSARAAKLSAPRTVALGAVPELEGTAAEGDGDVAADETGGEIENQIERTAPLSVYGTAPSQRLGSLRLNSTSAPTPYGASVVAGTAHYTATPALKPQRNEGGSRSDEKTRTRSARPTGKAISPPPPVTEAALAMLRDEPDPTAFSPRTSVSPVSLHGGAPWASGEVEPTSPTATEIISTDLDVDLAQSPTADRAVNPSPGGVSERGSTARLSSSTEAAIEVRSPVFS